MMLLLHVMNHETMYYLHKNTKNIKSMLLYILKYH